MKTINGYPCSYVSFGAYEDLKEAARCLKEEGMIKYFRVVELCKGSGIYELYTVDGEEVDGNE